METKFLNPNYRELLGFTPICNVSDRQIWNLLVTPVTKALLGPIIEAKVEVSDKDTPAFPGDFVSNFNQHLLHGKDGFVRNYYVTNTYKTQYGAFIVKRDGVKFKAIGVFGDLKKGKVEVIFKAALRDRRFDGTPRANDSALVDFLGYEDSAYNAPLVLNGKQVKSVELSIYGYMPGSRVRQACGDEVLEEFFTNPYRFLDRPELFRRLFDMAWKSDRAPGMVSNPIFDISRLVVPGFERIARSRGYDFIENAPSHYHVAMWSKAVGYKFLNPEMERQIDELTVGIKRIRENLKRQGIELTRAQESWICVVQSLRHDLIPQELNLNGPKWPQDNIGAQNLWMFKPISERGEKIWAEALKAEALLKSGTEAEKPGQTDTKPEGEKPAPGETKQG